MHYDLESISLALDQDFNLSYYYLAWWYWAGKLFSFSALDFGVYKMKEWI